MRVRIVDPKRVRSFARSGGATGQERYHRCRDDRLVAETFGEAPHQVHDAEREKLVQMVNACQGLIDLQTELQNRGEHSVSEVVRRMHARLLKKIAAEKATLELAIVALVKATPRFAELAEIIESVPGLADITSAA